MVKIDIEYTGDLHCEATHGPSGAKLTTDAPKDHEGRGETFSPTDLVATALGTCAATIMGIVARRHDIDLRGMRVEVTKEMAPQPGRRISRLGLDFHMPKAFAPEQCRLLEQAAKGCPVYKSLSPETEVAVRYHYPEG